MHQLVVLIRWRRITIDGSKGYRTFFWICMYICLFGTIVRFESSGRWRWYGAVLNPLWNRKVWFHFQSVIPMKIHYRRRSWICYSASGSTCSETKRDESIVGDGSRRNWFEKYHLGSLNMCRVELSQWTLKPFCFIFTVFCLNKIECYQQSLVLFIVIISYFPNYQNLKEILY